MSFTALQAALAWVHAQHCHTSNKPKTHSQRLKPTELELQHHNLCEKNRGNFSLPVFPKTGWEDADLVLSRSARTLAASCRALSTLLPWSLQCSHTPKSWVRQDCPSAACTGKKTKRRQIEQRKLGKVKWQLMAKMEDFLFNEKKRWIWIGSYVQRFV